MGLSEILPTYEQADYLSAFKLGCIFTLSAQQTTILIGRNPRYAAFPFKHCTLGFMAWTHSLEEARAVFDRACASLPAMNKLPTRVKNSGWLSITPAAAQEAIERAAEELGVALTPNARAIERAAAGIAKVSGIVAQARKSGQLKTFNRSYKQYRRQMQLAGQRPISYAHAVRLLRRRIIQAKAEFPNIDPSTFFVGVAPLEKFTTKQKPKGNFKQNVIETSRAKPQKIPLTADI